VVLHQAEGICGCHSRRVDAHIVLPSLPRPRERRFERMLISNAGQATVLAYLVSVDGIDNQPAQPLRLPSAFRQGSLGQLA
jgi:hypothetical protein